MKRELGILQIILSLCGVMMFGTVTYTAINMVNGQYQVEMALIPFLCEAAPNLLISYFLAYLALLAVRFLFLAL